MRSLAVYQKHPCDVNLEDGECPEEEYVGIMGKCSDERTQEISNFLSKAYNKVKAEKYVETAVCLNNG